VKTLAVVSTGLAGLALVLTQSRGGWFAVLLSLALLWLADVHRHGRWLAVPAIATALVSLVLLFPQSPITERLTGDDQGSSRGRLPLMRTALEIIRDHPLLGVGPNNYSVAMKQYGAVYGKWGDWTYTVHNKFLLVWAETGIGGLAAFLWFLWGTIRLGWSGWKASDPSLSPLALGFTAALIGQMVHMQVDLFNARPQVEMLWVLAALVAVIHAGTRISQPTSQVVA
jgi:O-antigen ligase